MNKLFKLTILGVLLSLSLSSLANAQGQPPKKTSTITAYLNVSVIDGTGSPLQMDRGILVRDGRIEKITASDDLKKSLPKGTAIFDGTGMFALPGLIDSHVHMATSPNAKRAEALMRRFLYSGITSVRDMAGDGRALADLARKSRLQKIPAPDLYYSALMAGPTFFTDPRPAASAQGEKPGYVPWMQAITPATNMAEAVSLARGTWATGIKIYANLPAEEVKRIVIEAKKQGIKTWAHSMVFPAFPSEVIGAGVDVMSHVCRLAFEISKEKPTEYHHKIIPNYAALNPEDDRLKALFDTMIEKDIILDATLRLYGASERRMAKLAKDKQKPVACPSSFAARLTEFAYNTGVDIAAGTDGMTPVESDYPALHEELEALVNQANMPPLQAIRSATYLGAKVLGLEAKTGTLQVGKKADMVLLSKNPLNTISNLRSVVLTVKGGVHYKRADYKKITKEELKDDQ